MKSIEKEFDKTQSKNPNWSSYTVFASTVRGKKYSEDRLKRMFKKLVSKDDYANKDKKGLIKNLCALNICPKRTENRGKFALDNTKDEKTINGII
jgi:hypothetical protein